MAQAKNKGSTLWEILTKNRKKDLSPLELQYHNPLKAKVGQTISFDHEPDISGINFVIEKMSVYETKASGKTFFHTDYHLKGVTLDREKPLRLRLRLLPDTDETNLLGCKVQLLHFYYEMDFDDSFLNITLADPTGEFHINQDDEGNNLETPRKYWRVEDVKDPWHARVTTMIDKNGDGKVEESELDRYNATIWDYWRIMDGKQTEFLYIEMNDKTKFFSFYRGGEISGVDQILVI